MEQSSYHKNRSVVFAVCEEPTCTNEDNVQLVLGRKLSVVSAVPSALRVMAITAFGWSPLSSPPALAVGRPLNVTAELVSKDYHPAYLLTWEEPDPATYSIATIGYEVTIFPDPEPQDSEYCQWQGRTWSLQPHERQLLIRTDLSEHNLTLGCTYQYQVLALPSSTAARDSRSQLFFPACGPNNLDCQELEFDDSGEIRGLVSNLTMPCNGRYSLDLTWVFPASPRPEYILWFEAVIRFRFQFVPGQPFYPFVPPIQHHITNWKVDKTRQVRGSVLIIDGPSNDHYDLPLAELTMELRTVTLVWDDFLNQQVRHSTNLRSSGEVAMNISQLAAQAVNEDCSSVVAPVTPTPSQYGSLIIQSENHTVKNLMDEDFDGLSTPSPYQPTCDVQPTVLSKQEVNTLTAGTTSPMKADKDGKTKTLIIATVAAGFFVVVLMLSAFLLYRQGPLKPSSYLEKLNCPRTRPRHAYFLSPANKTQTQISLLPGMDDTRWEVPYESIKFGDELGKGAFGHVVKAEVTCLPNTLLNTPVTVAVKTSKANATKSEKAELLDEIEVMKKAMDGLQDTKTVNNIVHMLGCVTLCSESICLIMEFVPHGRLLDLLRGARFHTQDYSGLLAETDGRVFVDLDDKGSIRTPEAAKFGRQISRGMEYLAHKKLVHRDLAARNILVGADKVLKVCDFGLTRDVYESDIYIKTTGGRLPVKWMAIESLEDNAYTTKSDVWSYGVVLWEICTLGNFPYPTMGNEYMLSHLKAGHRLPQPEGGDSRLYELMLSCWAARPHDRPSFSEVCDSLEHIIQDTEPYFEFQGEGEEGDSPEPDTSAESYA